MLVDPIIYSDRRSTEEAEIFRQTIGTQRLFEITANSPMGGHVRHLHALDQEKSA